VEKDMPQKNSRSVLVTGGAGFIGSHLVEGLLARGEQVKVLDNFSTGTMKNLEELSDGRWKPGKDFEVIRGDIRDPATLDKVMAGVGAVFHQAALASVPRSVEDPVTTQQVNVDGTLNVFMAALNHGVSRVVYASSSSVYGDVETLPKREGQEGPAKSPYALTKRINEEYGRLITELYGLETIGLRYFNVYGSRRDTQTEYAAVIPRFLGALLTGKPPDVYGSGYQTRDFTYVQDVVNANLLAIDAPTDSCPSAYNIGSGHRTSLLELLGILQDLLGTNITPNHKPARQGDVMHSAADTSRASTMLGFTSAFSLRQGLELSIDWYKSNL
jgi:nucleoside-diphosphate-sugar epimerase